MSNGKTWVNSQKKVRGWIRSSLPHNQHTYHIEWRQLWNKYLYYIFNKHVRVCTKCCAHLFACDAITWSHTAIAYTCLPALHCKHLFESVPYSKHLFTGVSLQTQVHRRFLETRVCRRSLANTCTQAFLCKHMFTGAPLKHVFAGISLQTHVHRRSLETRVCRRSLPCNHGCVQSALCHWGDVALLYMLYKIIVILGYSFFFIMPETAYQKYLSRVACTQHVVECFFLADECFSFKCLCASREGTAFCTYWKVPICRRYSVKLVLKLGIFIQTYHVYSGVQFVQADTT